jgi:hypothetical protein
MTLDPSLTIDFVEAPSAAINNLENAGRILNAAIAILEQGEDLLGFLSAENYSRHLPVAFNACIGGHYRHCLDHFTSLLRSIGSYEVDYDHRDRDSRIESEPEFARALTQEIRLELQRRPLDSLESIVQVRCEVSYAHGDSPEMNSTFGRELAYCIAHAIHHFALISVMARLMEIPLHANFGIAPSTIAHLRSENVGS